jgi:hypothetical protein
LFVTPPIVADFIGPSSFLAGFQCSCLFLWYLSYAGVRHNVDDDDKLKDVGGRLLLISLLASQSLIVFLLDF